jgi:hypothetical protein
VAVEFAASPALVPRDTWVGMERVQAAPTGEALSCRRCLLPRTEPPPEGGTAKRHWPGTSRCVAIHEMRPTLPPSTIFRVSG